MLDLVRPQIVGFLTHRLIFILGKVIFYFIFSAYITEIESMYASVTNDPCHQKTHLRLVSHYGQTQNRLKATCNYWKLVFVNSECKETVISTQNGADGTAKLLVI